MMSFNSIGDLSRSYQLRLGQGLLKNRLDVLTKEMTTGVKADIPAALGGDLTRISHIETRLEMLVTYQRSAVEANGFLEGMQSVLGRMQTATDELGPRLLSEAGTASDNILQMRASEVEQSFRSLVNAMNTDIGGRYPFSGSRSDTPPLRSFETMLAGLNTAIGTATTAADITARIDAWFDAPAGNGGFTDAFFQGDAAGDTTHAVSPEHRVDTSLAATTPELRDMFKGMAIMAYAAQTATPVNADTLRDLTAAAGLRLASGSTRLTDIRADLGHRQSAVAQAQARNSAETSTLSIARSALTSADPYETATALKDAEARLQSLYTLTARLSRLNLTDYLS